MRRLLPLALTLSVTVAAAGDDGWEQYADKGDITSYSRQIPDSRILGMRGVSTAPVHISKLMGVYLDASRATDWVGLLMSLEERPIPGTDNAIERHIFDMPWPVSDREFVFERTVTWEPEAKRVTIHYKSVEDAQWPRNDDYVRATDYGSYWQFTALPDGKTRIEAVALVDPEGALPAWLFNSVQRSWPRDSITGLLTEVAKPNPTLDETCKDW